MKSEHKLKVLYIGWHPEWYPRNWVLRHGLMRNGAEVRQMRVGPSRISRYLNLMRALQDYRRRYKDKPDIITVAEIDIESFPFAWALARNWRIPVVYDAFYPRYDAAVVCEEQINSRSLKAKALWQWECRVLHAADLILSDTRHNAAFFQQAYQVPKDKFEIVYIGTDQEIFKPGPEPPTDPFLVQYAGYYLRLHGAKYIIQAAHLLREQKDIRFEMIGYATRTPYLEVEQETRRLKLNNIIFRGEIPYANIPSEMQRASLCLGIFEDIGHAARVFPVKGFQALALARPLLTRDSPAVQDLLEPKKHIWTVPPANPRAIADAIMFLKNNPETRNNMAQQGHELFCQKFTPEKVTETLLQRLIRLVKNHS
jgi:glycosyltransferase involved in cell wall biosynthesis